MSDPTIEEKSLRILEWLEKREPGKWWRAGQVCEWHYEQPAEGEVSETHQPHEIPPPDLTSPEWFLRLLKTTKFAVWHSSLGDCWCSAPYQASYPEDADTPELALINALYDLAQRDQS